MSATAIEPSSETRKYVLSLPQGNEPILLAVEDQDRHDNPADRVDPLPVQRIEIDPGSGKAEMPEAPIIGFTLTLANML